MNYRRIPSRNVHIVGKLNVTPGTVILGDSRSLAVFDEISVEGYSCNLNLDVIE